MKKKLIGAVLAALMLGGAVTVSAATVITQDLKICLIGDVDNNGKVNSKDWAALRDHINKSEKITDEYMLACGDVDNNGKVNSKDWAALRDHINKSDPLW